MARWKMAMIDIKECLVHWEVGADDGAIACTRGYSRPIVRIFVDAAKHVGLQRGMHMRRSEHQWVVLTQQELNLVAAQLPVGAPAVVPFHAYIVERTADVPLAVIYQRLCDKLQPAMSWGTFYRCVSANVRQFRRRSPRITMRHDDPPPGNEAQVDCFMGRWFDPEAQRTRRFYAFVMTLSCSRHLFVHPTLGEDAARLDAHIAALAYFCGVPHRLVPNNLAAGIVRPDHYDLYLNRAYAGLTRYYGCLVDPSRIAHLKDKPRVESNVSDVRARCFRRRTFPASSPCARRVHGAREVAGQRTRGATGDQPLAMFALLEQAARSYCRPRRSIRSSGFQPCWMPIAIWRSCACVTGMACSSGRGVHRLAAGDSRYRTIRRRVQLGGGASVTQILATAVTPGAFLRGAAAFAITAKVVGAWQP